MAFNFKSECLCLSQEKLHLNGLDNWYPFSGFNYKGNKISAFGFDWISSGQIQDFESKMTMNLLMQINIQGVIWIMGLFFIFNEYMIYILSITLIAFTIIFHRILDYESSVGVADMQCDHVLFLLDVGSHG